MAGDRPAETVVFVHGLWMTGLEMRVLRRRVAAGGGYRTRRFRYRTVRRSVSENAARLKRYLDSLDAGTVHLVAHSLGGLVVLHLCNELGWRPRGRVVLLGSPVRGSRAARGMAAFRWGARLLGKSAAGGLAERHEPRWRSEVPLGVLAGTLGAGLGQLMHRLPRPHDGTVAVDETDLPGAADTAFVRVTHMSMLFSTEVAREVVHFLERGRFSAGARRQLRNPSGEA